MAKKQTKKTNRFIRYFNRNQRLFITLASGLFILLGSVVAIQFARGYRPGGENSFIQGTGLLSANSDPKDAQIYIDGELQNRVTDSTINLRPGEYEVEITKTGYTAWKKRLTIFQELVTSTNAQLFRTVPSLTPLTFTGATNVTPSPNGQTLAFAVASDSAQLKSGLYVLDLNDRPSLFSRGARLIAEDPFGNSFAEAKLLWSPDSQQLLASFTDRNYLLDPSESVQSEELIGATAQLPFLLSNWEQEITQREQQLYAALPEEMMAIATQSAKNIYFSPDGEKMLYTATASAVIAEELIPQLPASSTQEQERQLRPNHTYVYDLKEDRNFHLFAPIAELPENDFEKIQLVTNLDTGGLFRSNPNEATLSAQLKLQDPLSLEQTIDNFKAYYSPLTNLNYQWYPSSNHILISQNGSIQIVEYDGTNLTTLYSGVYDSNFVYPWPNGSKLIILTNVTQNPDLPPNLYTINLK